VLVSLHFTTLQVLVGHQTRVEYLQRSFLIKKAEYRAWCWAGLAEDELVSLATKALQCAS